MRLLASLLALALLITAGQAQQVGVSAPGYVATTWTPTITTDGTVGTPAYSIQVGSYERIGRQVTARFTISLSGWTGSPTGNVSVTLPVTSANVTNDRGSCAISSFATASSVASVAADVLPNTATARLQDVAAAGGATSVQMTAAVAGTAFVIVGSCAYHT